MQPLTHLPGKRTAQQQGRALAAAGTAEQVGHHGRNKDQRSRAQGKRLVLPHGNKDLVGGTATLGVKMAVQKYNDQAAQGQEINQPRVRSAQGRYLVKGQAKRRAYRPYHASYQRGQDHPFKADVQISAAAAHIA